MTTLAAAISKSLLTNLPREASTRFDGVTEEQFKEFLVDFLGSQLGRTKGGRAAAPKGKNGKGRISGYLLFGNENRQAVNDANPGIAFKDVGKRLGEMWRELSDEEQQEWKDRANALNAENGLPSPTPAAGKKVAPKATKAAPAKKSAKAASGKTVKRVRKTKA